MTNRDRRPVRYEHGSRQHRPRVATLEVRTLGHPNVRITSLKLPAGTRTKVLSKYDILAITGGLHYGSLLSRSLQ
jgi:hypothetical protein